MVRLEPRVLLGQMELQARLALLAMSERLVLQEPRAFLAILELQAQQVSRD
jgi:hypothetical protein